MHLIDSLEFDVALASEERAFAEQEQLQSFMRGPALRVIESVFDQVSSEANERTAGPWPTGPSGASGAPRHGLARPSAADVWRLDRLEIDLGPVSGPDLCGQWERRLRVRLLEQLRDRLRAQPAAAPASAATRSAATPGAAASMRPQHPTPGEPAAPGGDAIVAGARRLADLEALQHYLVQGCLPWHLAWPTGRSFSAWAQTVVLRDAPALARQLRRADTGLRQRLTRRLAEQLDPAGLEQLVRALGLPGHWPLAGWVEATARHADRVGMAEPAGALARRLWTTVLDEALQAPASARQARRLRAALRVAATGHGEASTPSRATVPGAPEAVSRPEPTTAVLRLRARLRHLWQRRQSHGLDAALRDSLRSDTAALAAWVAETGQAAAARHWLAASLPTSTWQRLLDLLAPSAAPLYGPLLRRRPLGAAWMRLSRSDWGATRTRLREAALAAVLLDPPDTDTAAISGQDWLHALARHAAALLNVEPASVWAVWCGPAGRRRPVPGAAVAAPETLPLSPSPAWRQAQAAVRQWLAGIGLAAQGTRSAAHAVDRRTALGIPQSSTDTRSGYLDDASPQSRGAAALAPTSGHAVGRTAGDAAAGAIEADSQDRTDPWADPWADSSASRPDGEATACDTAAQAWRNTADDGLLAAWLALSLRTAGARARWLEALGKHRLLDAAAQVAPAEAPWLQAWAAGSTWPLWSATGLHARACSPSSFWDLWWARWAARHGHANAGAAANAVAGAGAGAGAAFDRAGFVDAWLQHAARCQGVPLPSYLPGLVARLKSLQRHRLRSRRHAWPRLQTGSPVAPAAGPARQDTQAPSLLVAARPAAQPASVGGPGRRQPSHVEVGEQDDPVALVLRRARALASASARRQGTAPPGDDRHGKAPHAARPHATPALRPGSAGPLAQAGVTAGPATTPPTPLPTRFTVRQPQFDAHRQPAAEASAGNTVIWAWLMQDHGRLLLAQRPPALKVALEAALSDSAFADELAQRAPSGLWPPLLAWLRPTACGPVMAAVARSGGRPQRPPHVGAGRADGLDDSPQAALHLQVTTQGVPDRAEAFPPAPGRHRSPASQAAAWRLMLQHYFVEGRPHVPGEFEHRLARGEGPEAWPARAGTASAALPSHRAQAARPAEPARPAGLQVGQAVQVHNAGLVLLGAYAPRLFSMLGLTDGHAFVEDAAAARAVHLLQWLVDERSDREEHLLVLNKLLCGVPLATPLPREVVLTAPEQDAGRQMLQAVITHWNALGGTSVQGLRETFLQREGRLQRDDDAWRLRVAPRTFDMLLDRLPWGYATLKLPWMKEVLHVDWR